MCRLFFSLSTREKSPYRDLFKSKYTILMQSEIEGHKDGWGICSFSGKNLALLAKHTTPLDVSVEDAKALSRNIHSKCTGFFIRKASNTLGLDKDQILTIDATMPFTYQNISFIHNGSVYASDKIIKEVQNPPLLPRSRNDSEVYFIIFIKYLNETNDVYRAFSATIRFITNTYEKVKENSTDAPEHAYTSLNAIVADGSHLYALNKYTKNYLGTVSDPKREYYKMSYIERNDSIIVASEPMDDLGWNDIGNGKFLDAWIEGEKIKYSIKEI